ncbi:MAG: TrkH family potassium uptake protein [Clostridia bacterium]|nr:TrkH family potassium uptake protein [Clostridia bacterium]
MNKRIIVYVLGYVLTIEGLLMLPSFIVSLFYGEGEGWCYLATGSACIILGTLLSYKKPKDSIFYLKEGCIATALCWIVMSLAGAVPFMLTGEIPGFTNAVFETVSGFTTTGASILDNVEALSRTSLFWRSFTHWIGGMGVLVFLLAVVPLSGGSNFHLMRAESPGPSVGKLVPKLRQTARILYLIYFAMTVIEMVLLIIGRMPVFDAITTSFGTAGTGGFGIKNDSITSYSNYCQWVITVFMILFGVNFNAYYFILLKKFRKAFSMEEVKGYFVIIGIAIAVIFVNILNIYGSVIEALKQASFQVASIITTTGFATADFNVWNQCSKTILVLLMFIGACAGSTGGGIKVSRIMVLIKTVIKEFHSYIHPKSIRKIKIEGKPVEHEVVRATNVYFITFIIIFCASVLLVSFEGKDLVTNFTAVAATINNIGPGLELVGPSTNFLHFNPFTKWVLIFDMLAGRLELFPMLILFHPTMWKQMLTKRKK